MALDFGHMYASSLPHFVQVHHRPVVTVLRCLHPPLSTGFTRIYALYVHTLLHATDFSRIYALFTLLFRLPDHDIDPFISFQRW